MKNIKKLYEDFCKSRNIKFKLDETVSPYDDTTLFCPAGMQQFKTAFKDTSVKDTICNIQSCVRMNDFDEIGDATHLLYFNMMGMFSFRSMSLKDAVDFWIILYIQMYKMIQNGILFIKILKLELLMNVIGQMAKLVVIVLNFL